MFVPRVVSYCSSCHKLFIHKRPYKNHDNSPYKCELCAKKRLKVNNV